MITIGKVSGDVMLNEGNIYGDMVMQNYSKKQENIYDKSTNLQDCYEYDIAFSYASEQEQFVLRVAKLLNEMGIKVFVKPFYEQQFLAKDLHRETYKMYGKNCRFVACFISKEYWKKEIPRHEFSVTINRMKKEKRICIIPVMMDETRPPSLDSSIVYIDASSDNIVEMDVASMMESIVLEGRKEQRK